MTKDLNLCGFDYEVLGMLNGAREGAWGAAVGASLEYLSGHGLCTRGPNYKITLDGQIAYNGRPQPVDK